MSVTFAALYDALSAAGLDVGVAARDGWHDRRYELEPPPRRYGYGPARESGRAGAELPYTATIPASACPHAFDVSATMS